MPLRELIDEFKLPVNECSRCGGDGEISVFVGHVFEDTCPKCKGLGYTHKRKVKKSNDKVSKKQ